MEKIRLIQWCETATARIRFGPDRRAVQQELFDHLEDRQNAFLEQGLDGESATALTLEAMGDAKEIAPQLAAIHRPFWGYALMVSRIALIIVLIISLIPIWNYFTKICAITDPDYLYDQYAFHVYDPASYGGDTGRTLHHLSKPNVSFSSDGYRFTVTDAAMFTVYAENSGKESTRLFFQVEQQGALPWTETNGYYNTLWYSSVSQQFTARDSLGNFYYSYASYTGDDPTLYVSDWQTGLFTCTNICWINDFPKDAEWVEICYERDGRSLLLHIDLTGGGGK